MTILYMKKGDLLPDVTTQLIGPDGNPLNLTGVTSVTFLVRTVSGRLLVNRAASIVEPATDGRVRHAWVAGDTDTIGTHNVEWRVVYPGAKPMTIPSRGYDQIEISARLD